MSEIPYPWVEIGLTIGTWDVVDLAYLDTGFDGGLLVPAGIGREVLASPAWVPLRLADGETVQVRSWGGIVNIADHPFAVELPRWGRDTCLGVKCSTRWKSVSSSDDGCAFISPMSPHDPPGCIRQDRITDALDRAAPRDAVQPHEPPWYRWSQDRTAW
jgi:hypothetical protein